jgi:hypothetical protein
MSQKRIFITLMPLLLVLGCTNSEPVEAKSGDPQALAAFKPSPEARKNDIAYAYLDAVRADLSRGKAVIINAVMNLSPAEAEAFWTIYRAYEQELYALGDQRAELTRKYVAAMQAKTLDDATAQQLGSAWWDYEAQRLALVRKYYDRILKEVSPLRAAQFAQIEHRVNLVIDLGIASELPLVDGKY